MEDTNCRTVFTVIPRQIEEHEAGEVQSVLLFLNNSIKESYKQEIKSLTQEKENKLSHFFRFRLFCFFVFLIYLFFFKPAVRERHLQKHMIDTEVTAASVNEPICA